MIISMKQQPMKSYDEVFASAGRLCALEEKNYVEEEYFFEGKANVYERAEGSTKRIRFEGAPYTSRFLIRRPKQKTDFSGNIVVEIMNATPGFDLDRSWILTWKQIVRNGDIYIGLMSKPNVLMTMKRFDPERYSALDWKNPLVYGEIREDDPILRNDPGQETGLFWDILMDIGRLLKSEDEMNPAADFVKASQVPVKTVLMGWSQSGGYLLRYMKDFAVQEGEGAYDGYYAMGSAGSAVPALNQEDPRDPEEDLKPVNTDRPFIDMHTESDNVKIGSIRTRMDNGPLYRLYDIAGPSHDTYQCEEEYYAEDSCLKKLGRIMSYRGADAHPNNFPSHLAFQAGLYYLEKWIRTGDAPLTVDPVLYDPETLENLKDSDGNSLGGWRLPEITLPVCAYYGNSTAGKDPSDTFTPMVYGREEPFPKEELVKRYQSLKNYRELVEKETDRCIEKGLLLPEDREDCILRAVRKAAAYGLE